MQQIKSCNGHKFSIVDWRANRLVDASSEQEAHVRAMPQACERLLDSAVAGVRHASRLLGRVTYAANNHMISESVPRALYVTVFSELLCRCRPRRVLGPISQMCPQVETCGYKRLSHNAASAPRSVAGDATIWVEFALSWSGAGWIARGFVPARYISQLRWANDTTMNVSALCSNVSYVCITTDLHTHFTRAIHTYSSISTFTDVHDLRAVYW